MGFLVALFLASCYGVYAFEDYFSGALNTDRMESVQGILVALGGALIGATAITFSLVMFSMQVNVERMPHGLFRQFSSDKRLLLTFFSSFLLASSIVALSIVNKKGGILVSGLYSIWASLAIVFLFLFAYKRALDLVNPSKQLAFVMNDLDDYLVKFEKRVNKARFLIKDIEGNDFRTSHDSKKILFYKANVGWDEPVCNAILHCVSYSRRYASQGDYEVSSHALGAIVMINETYIKNRGKTFFPQNPLVDNPEAREKVFIETLEHLRQNIQVGVAGKDEQFLEANLRAIAELSDCYYRIDYCLEHAHKTHGRLAAGYLSSAIEIVIPSHLVDVCMEGARLLGRVGINGVRWHDYDGVTSISEKLALLASLSTANRLFNPLTVVSVEKISEISFELVRSGSGDIMFAVRKFREDIELVSSFVLEERQIGVSRPHNQKLSAIYSSTSPGGLIYRFSELANAIADLNEGDKDGERIIRNFCEWSDQIYYSTKKIFLLSIEKKSFLSYDLIVWIQSISDILMALSNTAACSDYNAEKLRNNALFLVNVLGWVPDEPEATRNIESYQLTETLFDMALNSRSRHCDEIYHGVKELIFSWTIKAGKRSNGMGTLGTGIKALSCLCIIDEESMQGLLSRFQLAFEKEVLDIEIRDRTAQDLRREAIAHHGRGVRRRSIDGVMAQVDQQELATVLNAFADILSVEQGADDCRDISEL